MAIISRDHRLLFIMAPHTACTAVGIVLREQLGGEFLPPANIRNGKGEIVVKRKHNTLADLIRHGLVTPEERAQLFTFSAVRNPFDVVVTGYVRNAKTLHTLIDKPGAFIHDDPRKLEHMEFCATHTFDEWIERQYAPTLKRRLLRWRRRQKFPHPIGVDFVMRYERIQDDFDAALARAGIGPHPLPRTNVTTERKRDYREYYSARSRELVEDAYREELDLYGYAF